MRKIVGFACAKNAGNVFLSRHRGLAIPARAWPLSDKKPMGFLPDIGHVRAVMHTEIAN